MGEQHRRYATCNELLTIWYILHTNDYTRLIKTMSKTPRNDLQYADRRFPRFRDRFLGYVHGLGLSARIRLCFEVMLCVEGVFTCFEGRSCEMWWFSVNRRVIEKMASRSCDFDMVVITITSSKLRRKYARLLSCLCKK